MGDLYWTNGGGDNLWSNPLNWDTLAVPTGTDDVHFGHGGTSANCTIDNVGSWLNGTLDIFTDYTGTITQGSGVNLTIHRFLQGNGTFIGAANATLTSQFNITTSTINIYGGTFQQGGAIHAYTLIVGNSGPAVFVGSSAAIDVLAEFTLSSGADFTATSGSMTLQRIVQVGNGVTFSHNGGTIILDPSGFSQVDFLDAVLNSVQIVSTGGANSLVLVRGTFPLGVDPTIIGAYIAVGVSAIATLTGSGTLTFDGHSYQNINSSGALHLGQLGVLDGFTDVVVLNANIDFNATCTIPANLNIEMRLSDPGADNAFDFAFYILANGKTFGTIKRTGISPKGLGIILDGDATIGAIVDEDDTEAHNWYFGVDSTYTIGSITLPESKDAVVGLLPNFYYYGGGQYTLTTPSGNKEFDWVVVRGAIVDVSPTWTAGPNSLDMGQNENWLGFNDGTNTGGGGETEPDGDEDVEGTQGPLHGRSRQFMETLCDIQRPNIIIDVSNIRDRRISQWGTVKSNVPCYIEPAGVDIVPDAAMGRTPVERYTVYFQGGEPVQNNDRLLVGTTLYTVEGVQDYSSLRTGWHMTCLVRKLGYAQR